MDGVADPTFAAAAIHDSDSVRRIHCASCGFVGKAVTQFACPWWMLPISLVLGWTVVCVPFWFLLFVAVGCMYKTICPCCEGRGITDRRDLPQTADAESIWRSKQDYADGRFNSARWALIVAVLVVSLAGVIRLLFVPESLFPE